MKSEKISRKFVETIDITEWEVETDNGWVDIESVGKTVKYKVFYISTKNHNIGCADDHIMFDENMNEIYAKELCINSFIQTKSGVEKVTGVSTSIETEHMYDLKLSEDSDHRYYTNGILSHNSIWLANMVAKAVQNGYNCAFVSLEMRDSHVLKRIGANMLGVQMADYNEFAKDVDMVKKKISTIGFESLKKPGKLFIKEYPTSSASTKDLEQYLTRMEDLKGIKFKIVFVDYINIMMNWRNPNTENTYMKIKQIAEDLRAMGQRNNWAIVTVTQINRGGFDTSGRLSIKDIAESSGLGHTVDWMGGIIQDPIMQANREYLLQTMLNRNEGYMNTRKKFFINYEFMRLTEDMESDILQDNV
jgi:replicative DNA helicase